MSEPHVSEAAVGRDEDDFRQMVEEHKRAVYYLALDLTGNHHDAEDLSQEVFIKAYRGREGFRGESTVQTWLRRIALNSYLNRRRNRTRAAMRFLGDVAETNDTETDTPAPDRHAEGSITQQHVERALDKLSDRERTAFVLRHYQDLPVKEISDSMGVADGTVKSLLFRATQKLRKELAFMKIDLDWN